MINAIVATECTKLNDNELFSLYVNISHQQGESDYRNYTWYDKARALFTEMNGAQVHEDTRQAIVCYAEKRLGLPPRK